MMTDKVRLPVLDGVRGFAALSVLITHAAILSGNVGRLSKNGDLAVDVFMVISGMLMSYHYHIRQATEPWEAPRSWKLFYLRRFFRIAPIYYVLLITALLAATWMGHCRTAIGAEFPAASTEASRYLPFDVSNLLWHISFLFGFHPKYAYSTPLPDWSIGLEMQFYLFFPFIMLLFRRAGFVAATVLLCALHVVAHHFLQNTFPMPSFLPLKIDYFTVGILMSMYLLHLNEQPRKAALCAIMAAVIALLSEHHRPVVFIVCLLIMYLMQQSTLPAARRHRVGVWGEALLGGRVAAWLADMSYSVYLVHLLLMLPIAATLIHIPGYIALESPLRCFVLFASTAAPAYLIAQSLHKLVEARGIALGKSVARNISG